MSANTASQLGGGFGAKIHNGKISLLTKSVNSQSDKCGNMAFDYNSPMNSETTNAKEERFALFAKNLEAAMARAGFDNANQLNKAANFSHPYINQVMSRRSVPKRPSLERIAEALGVTPEFLLGEDRAIPSTFDWGLLISIITERYFEFLSNDPDQKGHSEKALRSAARILALSSKDAFELCQRLQIDAENLPGIRAALVNAPRQGDVELKD